MEDAELYQDCLSGAPSTVLTESVSSSSRSSSNDKWIERNISKLECVRFTPVAADLAKCQCGKPLSEHPHGLPRSTTAWASASHTEASPTDAYGVIEFVSGPHPTRAHYIRVAANTQPEQLLHILTRVWRLRLPKLVLTVHGGIQNFELQPKLKKVVLNGILKAAKTTDAWVISTGLDNGISRYVGESISEEIHMKKHRIAAIGIAPWGVIRDREQLIGRNRTCKYFAISSSSKALSVLNRCHNYFILVDDGQSNVYGTEIQLRRAFERHLCSMRLDKSRFGVGLDRVPVVATLIEGGANVFRHVLDLTLDRRPIPVVVCDGSGRAADILAFIHKNGEQVLNCPALADQIVDLIRDKFRLARSKALAVFSEIRVCLQGPGRDLVSVFRPRRRPLQRHDAILTSLLSSHHLSHSSQLKLTMAWNRVDLARSHLFQYGQDWRSADLERAMMEALMNNRIEFVKLLLEWGVNVERFLTRLRLEDLYTFCLFGDETKGLGKYLRFLLKQTLAKFSKKQQRVSLYLIGRLVQELIGGGFVHEYTRRFCLAKAAVRSASGALPPDAAAGATGGLASEQPTITGAASNTLMNSIKSCGEDVIAKALFSAALFRAIMTRIDEDVHVEYYQELESWCDKYEAEALSMLEHCYKFDPRLTRKLVTYQLAEFGGHTCMSLAYTSRNHSQRSVSARPTISPGLRVFALCLVLLACPPLFFTLLLFTNFVEFKSLQELRDQPQTRDEFGDVESSSSSSSSSGSSVSSRDAEAKAHRVEQQADQHQASAAAGAAPASSLRNFMRQVPEESLSDKIDRLGLQSGGSGQANAKKSGGRVNFVNELPMTTIVAPQAQQHAGKTAQLPRIGSSGGGRAGASSSLHFPMKDSEYSGYQNYHTRGPQPQPQHSRLDRLPYRMRVSEFFSAPITRYWIHLITYAIFIVSFFSYVLVVLPESRFVWQEYLVFAYIVSYALDKVREISNCNGLTLRVKLQVHLSDLWNIYDLCICAFSLVGIALRVASVHSVNGAAADNSSFVGFYTNYSLLLLGNGSGLGDAHSEFARQFYVFFCSHNIMVISLALWLLRIFEVLINWKHLGPYLYMVATMISKMLPPVVIIFIPLCAFGIVRQGIQYPQYNTFNITVLKGVLLKPYFMLYGEVYAGEIDPDEWTGLESLMPLRCVVPIAMVIFLLVAVIVCISIIIAVFNDVYHEVHEKSKQVYKYLRFSIIIEYESMPMFPPPLTLVSWIFLTVRWLYHKRCRFWGCGGGGGGGGGGG
uniref:LSDAT_euk domain-containing protein n=1 Tax=Macrostomum lignano TaxID=282301 RepID=A0A1I8GE43_9PLAT